MDQATRPLKPRGFGLFTRIVYVHQAFSFALLLAALRGYLIPRTAELIAPHLLGLVLSLAVVVAMFGVASRHSLKALVWLRAMLWIGVINLLVIQLLLLAQSQVVSGAAMRMLFVSELISIPTAIYWSRPVNQAYLTSLKCP
jgi:hypothetical protein